MVPPQIALKKLTQQQLEAHLWGAANILRGKTAGQDYKNYRSVPMFAALPDPAGPGGAGRPHVGRRPPRRPRGSIAIERFIEDRQPLLTLHGHVHESARLTGSWQEKIGRHIAFQPPTTARSWRWWASIPITRWSAPPPAGS